MFDKFKNIVKGFSLLLCLVSASCAKPPPIEQVTLQFNWIHEAEFVGYYMAEAKGFYKAERLVVTMKEGGANVNARKLLLSKDADFSVLGFGEHRRNIEKNDPAIAIMAVFQISPLVLIVHADSGITGPGDLVGRRVGIKDENWLKVIQETLKNINVDPDSFIPVPVGYGDVEKFYNREVDVWTGFAHDEPNTIRMAGHAVNLIFPADYGVGGNEGMLVVRQETLDQKPELVARMVRAVRKGWKYAIEHPDESADILDQWQPGQSTEFHRLAVRALAPLVDTGQVPIGWMDEATWKSLLGKSWIPERPGFTLQFLEPEHR